MQSDFPAPVQVSSGYRHKRNDRRVSITLSRAVLHVEGDIDQGPRRLRRVQWRCFDEKVFLSGVAERLHLGVLVPSCVDRVWGERQVKRPVRRRSAREIFCYQAESWKGIAAHLKVFDLVLLPFFDKFRAESVTKPSSLSPLSSVSTTSS